MSLSQISHSLLNLPLLQENNTQELNNLKYSEQLVKFPVASCATILLFAPSFSSGYYWTRSSTDSAAHLYFNMTRTCDNITGGWIRMAKLDMRVTTNPCPSNLNGPLTRLCTKDFCGSLHFSLLSYKHSLFPCGWDDKRKSSCDSSRFPKHLKDQDLPLILALPM